jgi:ketosteroid isomerase-like protein
MKIIISFLATAFLATMSFAQEESASPAESTAPATEEKASATVDEASAPKATEATAPTAAKKAEPAKAASPAAAAKKESTANAAKPATSAAPAAAKMTKNMNPRDAENAWEAAVGKHDSATIEGFIAADFIGVSSKSKFIGRSDVLSEFKKDKDTYKTAKNEKLNVKMYGNDVAVATGRAREIGTGKDGKAFDRTFLYTDTWMMRGGKWQCVASQVSKIKG